MNNYVENLSMMNNAKSLDILATNSRFLHNYFLYIAQQNYFQM